MNTKNLPLVVGICLPILFVILIMAMAFTSSWSIKPEHNFIYSGAYDNYGNNLYKNTYEVKDGQLVLKPNFVSTSTDPYRDQRIEEMPELFLYDVKNDVAKKITFAVAQNFNLDPGPSSPDGYQVEYRSDHNGIFELFGSSNDNRGFYIAKDEAGKKLNGLQDGRYNYYSGNFKLLGWVK